MGVMARAGIGIDAIDIKRFKDALRKKNERFFASHFSATERAYCFSYRQPAPHFAGTFAAKEAVRKASGITTLPLRKIEIRHAKNGQPEVWLNGKRSRSLAISISHTDSLACAVALSR